MEERVSSLPDEVVGVEILQAGLDPVELSQETVVDQLVVDLGPISNIPQSLPIGLAFWSFVRYPLSALGRLRAELAGEFLGCVFPSLVHLRPKSAGPMVGDQDVKEGSSFGAFKQSSREPPMANPLQVGFQLRSQAYLPQVSKVVPVTLVRQMHARIPIQPLQERVPVVAPLDDGVVNPLFLGPSALSEAGCLEQDFHLFLLRPGGWKKDAYMEQHTSEEWAAGMIAFLTAMAPPTTIGSEPAGQQSGITAAPVITGTWSSLDMCSRTEIRFSFSSLETGVPTASFKGIGSARRARVLGGSGGSPAAANAASTDPPLASTWWARFSACPKAGPAFHPRLIRSFPVIMRLMCFVVR